MLQLITAFNMNIAKGTPCMQGWLVGRAETSGFSTLPKRQKLQLQKVQNEGHAPFLKSPGYSSFSKALKTQAILPS